MKQKKEIKKKTKKKGEKIKQETMDLLIENSIALQKTLTDLAGDINKLSKDIAEMLNLFKEASKAFSEGKRLAPGGELALREKLDILIEQSRVIAKGLVLLESYIKEKISKKEEEEPKPKPLPQFKF